MIGSVVAAAQRQHDERRSCRWTRVYMSPRDTAGADIGVGLVQLTRLLIC